MQSEQPQVLIPSDQHQAPHATRSRGTVHATRIYKAAEQHTLLEHCALSHSVSELLKHLAADRVGGVLHTQREHVLHPGPHHKVCGERERGGARAGIKRIVVVRASATGNPEHARTPAVGQDLPLLERLRVRVSIERQAVDGEVSVGVDAVGAPARSRPDVSLGHRTANA
eukprot:771330-Rhodomonas_salina.2